jgi:hypothetical protein
MEQGQGFDRVFCIARLSAVILGCALPRVQRWNEE